MICEGLGSGLWDLGRGKGKTPHANGMEETVETEMNMVFLWDLRDNNPARAEDAWWVSRLHKLLISVFEMNAVFPPF